MTKLTNLLFIIPLSCYFLSFSLKAQSNANNSSLNILNPFYITSNYIVKESIEVPNMPAYKTQDTMGECRAFSMATIIQKFICDNRGIQDCKNPPPNFDISYFGLMMYTHAEEDTDKTFNPFGKSFNSMYKVLNNYEGNGRKTYLNECNPFNQLINSFTTNGIVTDKDLKKYNQFVEKIKKLYSARKVNNTEAGIVDCPECLKEINNGTGLNANLEQLKEALKKETFGQFMYSLFFETLDSNKCKPFRIPPISKIAVFPFDSDISNENDIKLKIIDGLKQEPPVPILTPAVCLEWLKPQTCAPGKTHSMVISGYKSICTKGNKPICKDLIKIHNSYGESWQKANNDGWVNADDYVKGFFKDPKNINRMDSGSVIWIK